MIQKNEGKLIIAIRHIFKFHDLTNMAINKLHHK